MQTSDPDFGLGNKTPRSRMSEGGDEDNKNIKNTNKNEEKVEPSSTGGSKLRQLRRNPGVGDKPIKPPRRGGGDVGSEGDPSKNAIAFMQRRNSSGLSRLKRQKERLSDAS